MHALVYRQRKNRVKGRDWHDFEWYVRHGVVLHFEHFAHRVRQLNHEEITPKAFRFLLKERLASADIRRVKEDVLSFVKHPHELDIWSTEYFLQLADRVRIDLEGNV